jgi:hypothetical protein
MPRFVKIKLKKIKENATSAFRLLTKQETDNRDQFWLRKKL